MPSIFQNHHFQSQALKDNVQLALNIEDILPA